MKNSYLKKFCFITAMNLLISNYVLAAPHKRSPKKSRKKSGVKAKKHVTIHRSSSKKEQLDQPIPSDSCLIASAVNRVFPGQCVDDLPVKDVIKTFERYIGCFGSNAEPFAWDVKRLEIFTSVLSSRIDTKALCSDYDKHQEFYRSEFGLNNGAELRCSIQVLVNGLRELHATLSNRTNQTTAKVLGAFDKFSKYLQSNLSHKLAKRIKDSNNGDLSTLVVQISRRLK